MIYAKIYQPEDKTKDRIILFFGNRQETEKLKEKVKSAEKEGLGVNQHPYSPHNWLAINDFIPVSETFFYKK